MSRTRSVLAAGTVALSLAFAASANAGMINGGFETGDFTGWTQNLSSGGGQSVVSSHTGNSSTYYATEGYYFALLQAGTQNVLSSISQTYYLGAGQTMTGFAFFDSADYLPYDDYAIVAIYDSYGALVATPFYSNVSTVGDYGDGAWTAWTFTAGTNDYFTVTMGVANILDSGYSSYAGFDDIIGSEPIPEPATLALFGLGLVGVSLGRRRRV